MRLIDADELKTKVEAMVEHKVQESDYDYGRNQTLDYVADILIDNAPTIDICKDCDCRRVAIEALKAEPKTGEWIPVKWHEITDEEREREGYPRDWVVYIDCEMPCDGDEILVQTKSGYIRWDVCYEDGEFSLDSGWDWIEDIIAWMPLPEPYEGGDTE